MGDPAIFTAFADGRFQLAGGSTRCALGAAADKREGDGCTPLGLWTIRRTLFRPDRGAPPKTGLPLAPISLGDGWCDDPDDAAYNRPVALPYPARHERMWREDHLYDIVCVLGHNDDPPRPGRGSAIFLHLARCDYAPTEGCIALSRPDLEALLIRATPGSAVAVAAMLTPGA